jgi:hypothetical protein
VPGCPLTVDQAGARECGLADHLDVVREVVHGCQHRIEKRLVLGPALECLGEPFEMRFVVGEQHRFLGGEMPEEGALGDAGLLGQFGDGDVGEAVAGEPLQGNPTQRVAGGATALFVQVTGHRHDLNDKFDKTSENRVSTDINSAA